MIDKDEEEGDDESGSDEDESGNDEEDEQGQPCEHCSYFTLAIPHG